MAADFAWLLLRLLFLVGLLLLLHFDNLVKTITRRLRCFWLLEEGVVVLGQVDVQVVAQVVRCLGPPLTVEALVHRASQTNILSTWLGIVAIGALVIVDPIKSLLVVTALLLDTAQVGRRVRWSMLQMLGLRSITPLVILTSDHLAFVDSLLKMISNSSLISII